MCQDGRVEMRMETTGRKELVRWVLSWMPDVRVLAPKSFRDRIMEKLRDLLRAQEETQGPIGIDAPHGAPLPHHHSYGSRLRPGGLRRGKTVSGGSADQAGSGPGEDKPE